MGHFRSDQVREIRLNHTEWGVFEKIGGVGWLKNRLRNLHMAAQSKKTRNEQIKKDIESGMSQRQVAIKHGVAKATVWRIMK